MQRTPSSSPLPLLLVILPTIAACGGADDSPAQGVILDSAVAGLTYCSGTLSGITDEDGTFEYEPGNSVKLAIGDLILGRAPARPRLTIVDLVAGATDESDPTVTNVARFLQTIDDDADPDNGIQIVPAVAALGTAAAIDFSLSIADFEANQRVTDLVALMTASTVAGQRPLVSTLSARTHLSATLMSLLAGLYEGGYSGNETGGWQIYMGTDHSVTGWGTVTQSGQIYSVVGSAGSDGSIVFGDATGGGSFTGASVNRAISGTWENSQRGTSGRFVGSQSSPAGTSAPSESIEAVAGVYSGSFELGGNLGELTLTVLENGELVMQLASLRASSAIGGLVGSAVRVEGLAEDGTFFSGICTTTGDLSGDLRNGATGEIGTFQGQRELVD